MNIQVLAFLALSSVTSVSAGVFELPLFEVDVSSHYDLGFQMGEKFAAKITSRFDQSSELPTLLEFVRGGDGKSVYDAFLANATQKWPGYVSELKGGSHKAFKRTTVVDQENVGNASSSRA